MNDDSIAPSQGQPSTTAAPTRKRGRWWKRTLLVLFILFGLPTLGVLLWWASVRAEVNDYLARIRDAGEPVTPQELQAWYPTPPGENAADVYTSAFALLVEDDDLMNQWPGYGELDWPEPNEPLPQNTIAPMRAMLDKNAEAIRGVRAAAAIDGCRYPLDLTLGMDLLLPHLGQARLSARLLDGQASLHAEAGEGDEAAAVVHDMLRLARSFDNEPILISFLVGLSLDALAVNTTKRVIARSRPDGEMLARLQIELQRAMNSEARMRRALAGERASMLALFQGNVPAGVSGSDVVRVPGLIDYDTLQYLRLFDLMIQSINDPEAGKRFTVAVDNIPRVCVYTRLLLPATEIVIATSRRHEALLRCAATAIAAERHRREHGQLPASLDELSPRYLAKPYDDPFTDKPLRYLLKGDRAIIYSVGPDGNDDGGVQNDDRGPDIVFELFR